MGCGAGWHSERELANSGVTSVTDIEKLIWHPRTTETTKVELKEKFWSCSEDDYMVKDAKGMTYLKLSGKVLTMWDKMILLDPEKGTKVCMIQQKLSGDSANDAKSFQICTYKPKDEGQTSTETDDGTPVYPYAVVHEKFFKMIQNGDGWGSQYNMYYYVNNEKKEPPLFVAYRETWRWAWDSKVKVFKGDQVEKTGGKLDECDIVAKFGMFSDSWWENATDGNNRHGIEMTKDVDPVLQICMAIICDAMKDESAKAV